VWDVLSLERLTHRSAEELRRLYYQQGYGASASGGWRAQGAKPRNGESLRGRRVTVEGIGCSPAGKGVGGCALSKAAEHGGLPCPGIRSRRSRV